MRLNWTKLHTLGALSGFVSPFIFLPLVVQLMVWTQHFTFGYLWGQFFIDNAVHTKLLSLAVISNLLWFYIGLNKEKYGFSQGVLMASFLFVPYIIYVGHFS